MIKEFERVPLDKKILDISSKLLQLRTFLILQKHELKSKEDTLQKYLIELEVEDCDKCVHEMEMEFSMCKYLLQNLKV